MDDPISVDRIEPPHLPRRDEDGDVYDYQGWLHAPVSWTHERDLEKLWNRRHSSRLGVGLAVAGNPRRHFYIRNVRHSIEWARAELETLIAELEQGSPPAAGTATVGTVDEVADETAAVEEPRD